MKEKLLLKVSLVVGLIGLVLLWVISSRMELEGVEEAGGVEGIGRGEGEAVKIKGVVGKVVEKEKVVFLEVMNEKVERTKVVLFKEGEGIGLKEGDYVEIEGTVEEYEGEKEVIGSKVVKK